MDRVLRAYAHNAWTAADPLAGLDPYLRRAILLMPSTFRERWKLAPWTNRHQRRLAIADIIAERRLLYELTCQEKAPPAPTVQSSTQTIAPAAATSPYYQYRLAQHSTALDSVVAQRRQQDLHDFEHIPEARLDHERRAERREALLALAIDRAKLDLRELEIMAGLESSRAPEKRLSLKKISDKAR